jgi:hypothetical protein
VTLTSNLDPLPSLEYSIDGGAWTDFTFSGDIATTPSVNTGQTIAFRGDNTRFFYFDHDTHFSNFSCSQDCYLYGNMMSLLSADSYAMNTSVGEYAFCRLFKDNTHIYSHDTKQLALPATTLARSCYESLFQDCTHLTTAPNLPATTLATTCYNNMFSGCTGLVNAPEISATTLAYLCCANMFDGCTSLTTGPTLSATTLDDYCYYYMFKGCTSLNSVTCLATNISAENCTDNWLYGVAATGTFTAANNTVAWSEGTSGIPSGWTRVNQYNIVDLSELTGNYEAKNGDILINTLAGNYKITIAADATVTLDGATINGENNDNYNWAGITCLGNATIVLEGANTVKGFYENYPGIHVAENKTLTIQGTGSLNASSNGLGAGIGGGNSIPCGNIVIESGTITATGSGGAGIGSGLDAPCGNITISGGTITATGAVGCAGIGGGAPASCGVINISGGTIEATGGDDAAGIGGGSNGACSNITISGGVITATGGKYGAGIGSGCSSACGNITISCGTVTATGGNDAAGIGGGKSGSCGSITITSGVNWVSATAGTDAPNSIGKGSGSSCGTVTIGGTEYYDGSAYQNDGATYLATSPLVYPVLYLSGKFSVADGKQIQFARGNLQYTKSTATWSFMSRQYSTVETAEDNYCTENYGNKDVVSLFGWGTSGQNHGAVAYQPYSTIEDWDVSDAYNAYGERDKNLYDSNGTADWGYNMGSGWRTLTLSEWRYLFTSRWGASYKWGLATVVGVTGLVILPDTWSLPGGCSFTYGSGSGWTTNSYDADKWELMEAAGAVFLPAAGNRFGRNVQLVGNRGYYWCSSIYSANHSCADVLDFYNVGIVSLTNSGSNKYIGCAVRLVKDAE